MPRWGMVLDLSRCIGCYACVMACKTENGTPKGVFWAKVLEQEVGKFPSARRVFWPVLCNHCQAPTCVEVCPSGATNQRPDGIVEVDYNKCIGCRYCIQACPYNIRVFMDEIEGYFPKELTPYEKVKYEEWQAGTVTKCTFCVHRVDNNLEPACVIACPSGARVFGDLDDPNSKVSMLIRKFRGTQLRPEAATDPSVYYLS
ncbi:sulfate reduction electron transfer complex DsrMKJOP subunit DsrO [Chloroflexota bacterium]